MVGVEPGGRGERGARAVAGEDDGLTRALALHGWRWDARLAWARTAAASSAATPSPEAEAWRRLVDPDSAGTFDRRLAWADLDSGRVEALLHALEAPADADTAWLEDLTRLRGACRQGADGPTSDLAWLAHIESGFCEDPPGQEHQPPIAYAHLLWPIVAEQWERLARSVLPAAMAVLTPCARDGARAALLERLSVLFSRAIHAAFARTRGAGYNLMLHADAVRDAGTAPPVGYAAFCRGQLRDGLGALLDEFPVIGRLLVLACTQWTASVAELLERVHGDRAALHDAFGIGADTVMTELYASLSDPHRGGRTVTVLAFAQDERSVRIVYKPKDVRIEAAFQAFTDDLWAELPGPRAEQLSVLARDGYGYVSFVAHVPCDTPEALTAFYRHAGRLLCALYLLGASDCHYQNLVAHGSSLVLIDAETLFEGTVHSLETDTSDPVDGDDPLATSVLYTVMLPSRTTEDGQAFDESALGIRSSTGQREQRLGWRHVNTDDMVWTRVETPLPQPRSLPVPAGTPNPFAEHLAPLVWGFEETYRALMAPGRAALVAERIGAFAGIPRRFVFRNTDTYERLQRAALAPEALRDARVRGRTLDMVTRCAIVSAERPPQWVAIGAELGDLERLDIPYFEVPIGTEDLYGAGERVVGVLKRDGLAQAVARVQTLSDEDLAWQVRLIHASAQLGVATSHAASHAGGIAATEPAAVAPSARAGEARAGAVVAVREALVSSVVIDRSGDPTWLTGVFARQVGVQRLELAPPGLYEGVAGPAAFLYLCADRLGVDDAVSRLAGAVAAPLVRLLELDDPYRRFRLIRRLGLGMTGLGGLLRLFEVLARTPAARAVDWRTAAETMADALTPEVLALDTSLDVISGVAAALGPLARLHLGHPREGSATALARAATHLLQAQDVTTHAWPLSLGQRPLTGFSHGASGMGLALIEAGMALGSDRFVDAGARAFAYETSVFDAAARNWPDFRKDVPSNACCTFWCHGAPGIALARLRALQLAPGHADADRWRDDLVAGAETTCAVPLGPRDHLCCGNLGRAAVLRALGDGMAESRWREAADAITTAVVARADQGDRFGWGLGGGPESPGLMQGLSGIGLHLLAADDQRDLLTLIA